MPSYTLSALEGRVWDLLDQNTLEFPEPNVRAAINQGLYYLNLVTGYQQVTVGVPGFTVAGQLQYSVPAGILIPTRVDYEGQEIERCSLERLARLFPDGWCTDQSSSYGPPARWASVGCKTFVIHPIDSYGSALLEVTGVANVKPLVNQDDVVMLEDTLAEILVKYGKIRVMLKETGKAFGDAIAEWKVLRAKIQAMTIWENAQWPLQWSEKQTTQGSGRWPRQ